MEGSAMRGLDRGQRGADAPRRGTGAGRPVGQREQHVAYDCRRLLRLAEQDAQTGIAIALLLGGNGKVDVPVSRIRKQLSDIAGHARSPCNGADQAVRDGAFGSYDPDLLEAIEKAARIT